VRTAAHRAATLLALAVLAYVGAESAAPTPASAGAAAQKAARKVVNLTNAQRIRAGCPRVTISAALSRAARAHSREMAARRRMSHVGANGRDFVARARAQGYRYSMGENIAYGFRSPRGVVRAWTRSPGHRRNLLNCQARKIGVGVARSAKGVRYWTQVFGSR